MTKEEAKKEALKKIKELEAYIADLDAETLIVTQYPSAENGGILDIDGIHAATIFSRRITSCNEKPSKMYMSNIPNIFLTINEEYYWTDQFGNKISGFLFWTKRN